MDTRAKRFVKARTAHRSVIAQDYVETILDLIEEDGDARLTELAARIGVAHPTVSKALKKLERDDLVRVQRYKQITLTRKGEKLARECRERHDVVARTLEALGVSKPTAELDAEGIEHHVSTETLHRMRLFLKRTR